MTDHLASAIRRIMDHYDADPLEGDRYVAELADRVEAAAEPDVHELAAAGLDPEQEIRARALDAAARLLAPLLSHMSLSGAQVSIDGMASKARIRLTRSGLGTIHLDDHDVSEAVAGIRLESRVGCATVLTLELPAVEIDADVDGPQLAIKDAVRELLVAHGWTPPTTEETA